MFEPKIPYITLPEIPILPSIGDSGPITIKPFGTLVAIGVYVGWLLVHRQAKKLGFSLERFSQFIGWTLAGGFIGGHVFDVLLYHPSRLVDQPAIEALKDLVFIWRSQSSFGGFMGACLGMLVWRNRFKIKSVLPYCDTMASGFPIGWVFGRSGCSVAHDHPGMKSDHWLALRCSAEEAARYVGCGRFDLGSIEMLVTVPLAIGFLMSMRKPRPWGFYIGVMSLYYAPIRFGLDFLRARDVRDPDLRYVGLTPAQWLCVALFMGGLLMLGRAMAAARRGETPTFGGRGPDGGPDGAAPPASAGGDDEEEEVDDGADDEADDEAEGDEPPSSGAASAKAGAAPGSKRSPEA